MKTLDVDITFTRDFLSRKFGIPFDSSYFENIIARSEIDRRVQMDLYRTFGDVGLGVLDPKPEARLGYDDTLNISLMFGGELRINSGVSWVESGFYSRENISDLTQPPIAETWPNTLFLDQYELAKNHLGKNRVYPPRPHGIFEIALDMFGEGFLEDFYLQPDRVDFALDVLTATVVASKEFWDRKCYGRIQKNLSLGGCSTTMLSPGLFRRFLMPRYAKIAHHFKDAFICACGKTTQHLQAFSEIEDACCIRVGWGTDLNRTASVLAGKHVKAGLHVVRIAASSETEVEKDVAYVLNRLKPVPNVSLLLIHAGAETPEKNIRALVQSVLAFAEENDVEIRDTASCRLKSVFL